MSIMQKKEEWKKRYTEFLVKNLSTITTAESMMKTFSYFVAGRLSTNHSTVIAELLYSSSNLITLLHDRLLRQHHKLFSADDNDYRWLKSALAALECMEVFIEVAAKKYGSPHIRWILIFTVELIKTVGRFMLLFKYKTRVRMFPIAKKLNRKMMDSDSSDDDLVMDPTPPRSEDGHYTLAHSGRKIKSVAERYKPQQQDGSAVEESVVGVPLSKQQVVAESLHNLQPLVHLFTASLCGEKSWLSWLASLSTDITSLRMLQNASSRYSRSEEKELLRRKFVLFMYLLRSPCYDKYTQVRLLRLLDLVSRIPGLATVGKAVKAYLPEWQSTYFYTWSS